jgi:hypothetical protein
MPLVVSGCAGGCALYSLFVETWSDDLSVTFCLRENNEFPHRNQVEAKGAPMQGEPKGQPFEISSGIKGKSPVRFSTSSSGTVSLSPSEEFEVADVNKEEWILFICFLAA